jgi:hypothetical protein
MHTDSPFYDASMAIYEQLHIATGLRSAITSRTPVADDIETWVRSGVECTLWYRMTVLSGILSCV